MLSMPYAFAIRERLMIYCKYTCFSPKVMIKNKTSISSGSMRDSYQFKSCDSILISLSFNRCLGGQWLNMDHKKAFIFTQAVRSYSYKINHHNNSSSTIEFTYCVHFGDEHLKNLAFMKSAGNETITSAWQSRNLRREIQLTNKTHWGHRADKKIFKVVGLTKKSPWGHKTDTTNIKHFSLTKKPLKTFSSKKKNDSLKPLIACKWQKRKLEDINLGTKTEI